MKFKKNQLKMFKNHMIKKRKKTKMYKMLNFKYFRFSNKKKIKKNQIKMFKYKMLKIK